MESKHHDKRNILRKSLNLLKKNALAHEFDRSDSSRANPHQHDYNAPLYPTHYEQQYINQSQAQAQSQAPHPQIAHPSQHVLQNQKALEINAPCQEYLNIAPAAVAGTAVQIEMEDSYSSYPIVLKAERPIAVEGVCREANGNLVPYHNPFLKQGCIEKCAGSVVKSGNDFQVFDLTDKTDPVLMKCARCTFQGYTVVKNTLGPCTYVTGIALCCLAGILGLIPCFCKRCQYVQHYCNFCMGGVFIF